MLAVSVMTVALTMAPFASSFLVIVIKELRCSLHHRGL
jgi:hypothetical protein